MDSHILGRVLVKDMPLGRASESRRERKGRSVLSCGVPLVRTGGREVGGGGAAETCRVNHVIVSVIGTA